MVSHRVMWRRMMFGVLMLGMVPLAACGVLEPIGSLDQTALSQSWASRLYVLPSMAYKPVEAGTPAHVRGAGTPPGGLVIVPSQDRYVRALDARNGTLVWSVQTAGPNQAQPIAVGDDVIVASLDGRVYRLRQATGEQVWVTQVAGGGAIMAAPTVAGERFFVSSIDNRLSAMSLATGDRLWDRRRAHPADMTITGQAGAAVSGEMVVTGFSDGRLVAYATQDGATLWDQDLSGGKSEFTDVDTTPVFVGDLIVAGCHKVGLFGVNVVTGDVTWMLRGVGFGTPVLFDGLLYVSQANGRYLSIDPSDGRVLWLTRVHPVEPKPSIVSRQLGPPAVSHKHVLAPVGSSLLVLDRMSGRAVSRLDDMYGFSATPEIAWGQAYAPANSGVIFALGLH
jgi:outer membrane protein assembly factor BamB